jgi:glucosamine-6-phosphate deaminase
VAPESRSSSRLIVVRDAAEFARKAADEVVGLVTGRPNAVLALPTGRTPIGLYEELVDRVRGGRLDLSRVTVFALDEFAGIPHQHPTSNVSHLVRNLLAHVPVARAFSFDGASPDYDEECRSYEKAIAEAGGIDLAILGIGRDGHLAFNEPGSPFDSRTRLVKLRPETRADLTWAFSNPASAPASGLTMGLGTIMEARAILLLAAGDEKADILTRALRGRPTTRVPASVLQRHPRLTVIADKEAAALLQP